MIEQTNHQYYSTCDEQWFDTRIFSARVIQIRFSYSLDVAMCLCSSSIVILLSISQNMMHSHMWVSIVMYPSTRSTRIELFSSSFCVFVSNRFTAVLSVIRHWHSASVHWKEPTLNVRAFNKCASVSAHHWQMMDVNMTISISRVSAHVNYVEWYGITRSSSCMWLVMYRWFCSNRSILTSCTWV
jgi:hypothetical protein